MQEITEFRKPLIEDVKLIRECFMSDRYTSCDYSSANVILWSRVYNTEIVYIKNMLIVKFNKEDGTYFLYPTGTGNQIDAFKWIENYCKEQGIDLRFGGIEPGMFDEIDKIYPGRFTIEYQRDSADYVYLVEKLATLSGKKYHGKKNHINKFIKMQENWSYERINSENIDECVKMIEQWCIENGCCEDEDKIAEICICIKGIKYHKELSLTGGIIRTDQGIVALTLGEKLNDDTFVIHFEKAFSSVQGAYPIINQQFIINELMDYKYVNREEDLGLEGLRRAKESYRPIMMAEKGTVIEK